MWPWGSVLLQVSFWVRSSRETGPNLQNKNLSQIFHIVGDTWSHQCWYTEVGIPFCSMTRETLCPWQGQDIHRPLLNRRQLIFIASENRPLSSLWFCINFSLTQMITGNSILARSKSTIGRLSYEVNTTTLITASRKNIVHSLLFIYMSWLFISGRLI